MSGTDYGPATPAPAVLIVPTIGRIVWLQCSASDAQEINRRRKDYVEKSAWHSAIRSGAQVHVGNSAEQGKLYPAMVVATWGSTPQSAVNLQVFLDGNDTYWATSRCVGDKPGDYQWMPYQKGQAAKTEALENQAKV